MILIFFMGVVMLKVPKVTGLQVLKQYFKIEVRDKFDFLHEEKHEKNKKIKVFYKLLPSFLPPIARHA